MRTLIASKVYQSFQMCTCTYSTHEKSQVYIVLDCNYVYTYCDREGLSIFSNVYMNMYSIHEISKVCTVWISTMRTLIGISKVYQSFQM